MNNALLEVKHLKKYFKLNPEQYIHAVDDVSFFINKGETLGLVGESGCGKTTVGHLILHLLEPDSGEILFYGQDIIALKKQERKKLGRKIQIIFQDPYTSLNPRKTVKQILSEPFIVQKLATGKRLEERIAQLSDKVGLESA